MRSNSFTKLLSKLFSKLLLTALFLTFSSLIFSVAFADLPLGKNALLVNFGVAKGGPALGLDFEHGYDHTYGIGGYFRINPDDKDNNANGLTAVGAFVRPHFSRQAWDLYVSPGFGLIFYKPVNDSSQTLMGPSLAIGLLYEFSPAVSFGAETMTFASWIGKNAYRGHLEDDLMAKFRFIF